MSRQQTRQASQSASRPSVASAPPRAAVPANVKRQRPSEDEIRILAYHKWVAAGQPQGDGVQFWMEAERELIA